MFQEENQIDKTEPIQSPEPQLTPVEPTQSSEAQPTLVETKPTLQQDHLIEVNKILVVDDNQLNLKVAERSLKSLGLEVDSCLNGYDCIEKVKNGGNFDLILMDIMMPELGGEETFQKLKEIEGFHTPVIAFTADAVSGAKEKYLSEGFTGYLSKPFSKEDMSSTVKNAIENESVV